MISYDLAKQLKDSGFPKDSPFCTHCQYPGHDGTPTLSELIEACGPRFFSLNRHEGGCFVAVGLSKDAKEFIRTELAYKNITPEEAVTNLWLELNKK